jgi:hypothetical protein
MCKNNKLAVIVNLISYDYGRYTLSGRKEENIQPVAVQYSLLQPFSYSISVGKMSVREVDVAQGAIFQLDLFSIKYALFRHI